MPVYRPGTRSDRRNITKSPGGCSSGSRRRRLSSPQPREVLRLWDLAILEPLLPASARTSSCLMRILWTTFEMHGASTASTFEESNSTASPCWKNGARVAIWSCPAASCGRANSPPQLRRGGRDIKKDIAEPPYPERTGWCWLINKKVVDQHHPVCAGLRWLRVLLTAQPPLLS